MTRFLAAVFVISGCVSTKTERCPGTDTVCPVGTECTNLTAPDELVCAPDGDIAACAGMGLADGAGCTTKTHDGFCHDGVCLEPACGNQRVDPGEACDDGNNTAGDGCSPDCLRIERCGDGVVDPVKLVNGVAMPNEQCDDKNHLSGDGCSSTCLTETLTWRQLALEAPPTMFGMGAAYDRVRGRIVIFGGSIYNAGLSDHTFLGNALGWTAIAADRDRPGPRAFPAMAFDEVSHQVVLFGGDASLAGLGSPAFDDTWSWDGDDWTRLSPATRPPPRGHATLVSDTARKKLVLFGGSTVVVDPETGASTEHVYGDTWEFDGATWKLVVPEGSAGAPPARAGQLMAYDPVRGVVVMAGGRTTLALTGAAFVGDTWEYDGAHWAQSGVGSSTTPATFFEGGAAYDTHDGHVLAFGGVSTTNALSTTTYRYDAASGWSATATTLPSSPSTPARLANIVVAGPADASFFFGGVNQYDLTGDPTFYNSYDELVETPTMRWAPLDTLAAAAFPPVRGSAGSTVDAAGNTAWMFGGSSPGSVSHNDLWQFTDGEWHRWIQDITSIAVPSARYGAMLAWDGTRGNLALFGGLAGGGEQQDTWTYSADMWTPHTTGTKPPPRVYGAMGYDPTSGLVVLFGGNDGGVVLGDTWLWNGSAWSPGPTSGPSARYLATTYFDPNAQALMLFGGVSNVGGNPVTVNDTWRFDGATLAWKQLDVTGPTEPRYAGQIAYDANARRAVLVGGFVGPTTIADTWALDDGATAWHPLAPSASPPARATGAAFPARDGRGIYLFGGIDETTFFGDAWRLTTESATPHEACLVAPVETTIDVDGDGEAGCMDPDCWYACALPPP